MGASLLANLALDDLVAGDEEAYLRAAVDLAGDRERLTALRQELRLRMEGARLTDGAAFTRGLEAAYREMWRRHCARGEA